MKLSIAAGVLVTLVSGCAAPTFTTNQMNRKASGNLTEETQRFAATKPIAAVREINEPAVTFKRVPRPKKLGDVNIHAAAQSFGPLLSELSKSAGYSVVFADNIDVSRKVSVEFNNANLEDAMRTTAFLAGYAAVLDKDRRTITVAENATYTFKIPAGVFSVLSAKYTVGGNPANSASSTGASGSPGGSGGGSSGGSSGGSTLKAEFTITGDEGASRNSIEQLIIEVAGANSKVMVSQMGFITVKGNAQSLKRVTDFLKKLCADAMTQVNIEASIIEVSLNNDFALGIQWEKVLKNTSAASSVANVIGSALTATGTTANSRVIIDALQKYADVKIVSEPKIFSMNNTPGNFIEASQIPYLGNVSQTASSAAGGAPTTTGSTAFAIDGISFSAVPSVVNEKNVQITLIPVISTVGQFDTFNLGVGAALKAPHTANKQSFMRVMAETGKTLILGGVRQQSNNTDTSLLSSTQSSKESKETVILLRATIVPPVDYEPLVGESI